MMMRSPMFAALLFLLGAPGADAELRQGTFPSQALGRDVAYVAHLPPSYARGGGPYPVIYTLHGLFEGPESWARRGLAAIAEELWAKGALPETVIVAVDGGNSFFTNSARGRFEDVVTSDLIAHVEATYRVRKGRAGRGLLGISMGGYAAIRIALSRPDVFARVATHSAMLLTAPPSLAGGASRGHMSAFEAVFSSPIDPGAWRAADPLRFAEKPGPGPFPALRFDCGREDRYGLARGHQVLHERLDAAGVPHTLSLPPGDHGYEYVRSQLPESLAFLAGGKAADP